MMAQEGHLASSSLLSGFEALAKLDYDQPGSIYSMLFQLATGIERLMKIAFILDYKVKNDLNNPSDKELRKHGHNLVELYGFLRGTAEQRYITVGWFAPDTSNGEILSVLSQFARASRYYNVDQLVGGRDNPDPLTKWFSAHMRVAEDAIRYKRLNSIMDRRGQ